MRTPTHKLHSGNPALKSVREAMIMPSRAMEKAESKGENRPTDTVESLGPASPQHAED